MLVCRGINVAEVYTGLRAQEEERTKALLESLEYYPITFPIAEHAGLLRRDHSRKGTTLSITDNTKDFPMQEIRLYPLPRN